MITLAEFAAAAAELALNITCYKLGKSGQYGQSDCIGLVMGAMAQLGKSGYPLHSTNYFARYEMDVLEQLDRFSERLQPGLLVYKARSDQGQLDERYCAGGTHHAGDALDYYHVGVITCADPIEITHCTSVAGGIKRDTSFSGWTHIGCLKGVDNAAAMVPASDDSFAAVVTAATGKTVRLRKTPDDNGTVLDKLPIGSAVTVLADAQGWAKIRTSAGQIGYMMSEFLHASLPQEAPAAEWLTLQVDRSVAEALLCALQEALGGDDA